MGGGDEQWARGAFSVTEMYILLTCGLQCFHLSVHTTHCMTCQKVERQGFEAKKPADQDDGRLMS